tara:strand:- start:229 stop:720 length:492 start_codon:yes stop_codon:yes gene_type:complete
MSFTRFHYDKDRVNKNLQQSTDPCRYILNKPGFGDKPVFFNDPQMRMQEWGANLRKVYNGHPIDIHSDLTNRTRKLSKDCLSEQFPNKGVPYTREIKYPIINKSVTDESRVTHPAWMYRDLEQNRFYPLHLDPQENVCLHFHNNLNTRLIERDNFKPIIPKID